tara:strand:- start:172325 stop:172615 length:291 start_codon:yes stop_codon:yes gene_type:complete
MNEVRLDLDTLKTQRVDAILKATIKVQREVIDKLFKDMTVMANSADHIASESVREHNAWVGQRVMELAQLTCRELGHSGIRNRDHYCPRCGVTFHI